MEVRVAPGETIESALRRFKKATQKAGILAEARNRTYSVEASGTQCEVGSNADLYCATSISGLKSDPRQN